MGDSYHDNCPACPFFRQLGGARSRVEESSDCGKVTARICQVEREREREGERQKERERRERHKEKEKGDKEREVV